MKRFVCLLLALVCCMGLCACQTETPDEPTQPIQPTQPNEPNDEKVLQGYVQEVCEEYLVLKEFDDQKNEILVHVKTKDASRYCKYDFITVLYTERIEPEKEGDSTVIIAKDITVDRVECDKPIIYFYPETEMECSVRLNFDGKLTCTYPAYQDEWNFIARPDGTLVFPDGKEYYALYWEGISTTMWDTSKGFCIKGEDTAEFLEWALAAQGLNARETNEFIVYWLPLMQDNAYNVISFQTDVYTSVAELDINPAPDSMLRVFMTYYASDEEVQLEPQTFEPFTRKGFTVVEWGGGKIN